MKDASFRIIHFPPNPHLEQSSYAGIAWNYSEGVLLATSGHSSYTKAREDLEQICSKQNVRLCWFDGEYNCSDGETLEPLK